MLGRLKRLTRLDARWKGRQPRLESLERRELLTTYTVTSEGDTAVAGSLTLRQAITAANADHAAGGDTINFAIGTGTETIALLSPLPAITGKITIDGLTQPAITGNTSAAPRIIIDGTKAGTGASGLTLTGPGGSQIDDIAVVNFTTGDNRGGRGIVANDGGSDTFVDDYLGVEPDGRTAAPNVVGIELDSPNNVVGSVSTGPAANLISGNSVDGVQIFGARATGNTVLGNFIGTDATGELSVADRIGVAILAASNNTIGGASVGAGNVIAGNSVAPDFIHGIGIEIAGASSGNIVAGNLIGVDRSGTSPVANYVGIYLGTPGTAGTNDSVTNTTIGGTVAGAGNTIAGNGYGITGNVIASTIAGNRIGTDITGTKAIGNIYGIYLGAVGTTIGGTNAAAANVIAASRQVGSVGGTGLYLTGDGDTIEGNYVGTNAAGTAALPNATGMSLHTTNTKVGGTTAGTSNLIAGNTGDAIDLDGSAGNTIQGNTIGQPGGGPLGNAGAGIHFVGVAATDGSITLDDTIGGTATGAGNVITGNGGAGITVDNLADAPISALTIRGNRIGRNAQLGIDLTGSGTPIPSTLQVTPTTSGTTSTVNGVIGGMPGEAFIIDLYGNSTVDPSGYGQGQTYLGSVTAIAGPGGFAEFSKTLTTPLAAGSFVTATATDPTGSTSEFSLASPTSVASADLGLTQQVATAINGDATTVTFTAQVTNNGATTAHNVVVTDQLASNLLNPVVTTTVGTAQVSNTNAVADLGDLAPGESATVTITASSVINATISNTVGVIGTDPDPNYANNLATQPVTTSQPQADLAIAVSPSPTSPTVGSNLTYIITVSNSGPNDATNVVVNDFLPSGATLVSATPSQGAAATVRGTLVSDNLGTITPGGSATFTVVVTPTTPGTFTNSVNVSGGQFDPVVTNNSASSTLTVAPNGTATLALTQTLSPTVGTPGQPETFTLTVQNTGTAAATGVILVDSLPATVTYVSATPSQGSPATISNSVVITSNLGTIAAGASSTLTIIVTPKSYANGLINYAAAVATGASPSAPVDSQSVLNVPNGPTVTSVLGSRSNAQLVVNFSAPITPASATTKANYRLYALGSSPRAVTASDLPIAFTTAYYNALTNSVTLTPSRSINATQYYALVIVGNTAAGITDTSGRKLAGAATGTAGTNYSTTFLASQLPQV